MNLYTARKMVDFLDTIKTQDYKQINVGFIRDSEDKKKYGGFCVRIYDTHDDEICEYYAITHYNYKRMREEVRTNYENYYREHGHLYYKH